MIAIQDARAQQVRDEIIDLAHYLCAAREHVKATEGGEIDSLIVAIQARLEMLDGLTGQHFASIKNRAWRDLDRRYVASKNRGPAEFAPVGVSDGGSPQR